MGSTYALRHLARAGSARRKAAKAHAVGGSFMSGPGAEAIKALSFKAAVDHRARFKSSYTVGAHFGLMPRARRRTCVISRDRRRSPCRTFALAPIDPSRTSERLLCGPAAHRRAVLKPPDKVSLMSAVDQTSL